jgi:hypothetical protein
VKRFVRAPSKAATDLVGWIEKRPLRSNVDLVDMYNNTAETPPTITSPRCIPVRTLSRKRWVLSQSPDPKGINHVSSEGWRAGGLAGWRAAFSGHLPLYELLLK